MVAGEIISAHNPRGYLMVIFDTMKYLNKNLPASVLAALTDFIIAKKENNRLFSLVDPGEYLFRALDNDKTTGFYFQIEKFDQSGFLISYQPRNKNDTSKYQLYSQPKEISTYFEIWHSCLLAYSQLEEKLKDAFKDPYLKNLEDEFLSDFDLQEETKNDPLSLKQIYLLEENLSKIENGIGIYINESNASEIAEIIEESINLRSQLAKQTKEWVAKKLSTILAKITKEGPDILKNIFKEAGKQIMTQGIKFLLEHGDKLIL